MGIIQFRRRSINRAAEPPNDLESGIAEERTTPALKRHPSLSKEGSFYTISPPINHLPLPYLQAKLKVYG
jgi:hypothetical protein